MRFSIALLKSFFQQLSTLRLPLSTNAYVFAVVVPLHSERRPKIWLHLQATAIVVVQCRKDLTKINVCYALVQSMDDLKKKYEKVTVLEHVRELEVRQYFLSLFPL